MESESNPMGETDFMLSESNWEFVEKKLIAHNTYDFTLKSDQIKVPSNMKGLSTMGQHFLVSHGGINRYYSFTLALSPHHE